MDGITPCWAGNVHADALIDGRRHHAPARRFGGMATVSRAYMLHWKHEPSSVCSDALHFTLLHPHPSAPGHDHCHDAKQHHDKRPLAASPNRYATARHTPRTPLNRPPTELCVGGDLAIGGQRLPATAPTDHGVGFATSQGSGLVPHQHRSTGPDGSYHGASWPPYNLVRVLRHVCPRVLPCRRIWTVYLSATKQGRKHAPARASGTEAKVSFSVRIVGVRSRAVLG